MKNLRMIFGEESPAMQCLPSQEFYNCKFFGQVIGVHWTVLFLFICGPNILYCDENLTVVLFPQKNATKNSDHLCILTQLMGARMCRYTLKM